MLAKGLKFVFRSVHEAVETELENEKRSIRDRLNELYLMLERGEIDEDTFDDEEEELLDRLDALEEIV